MDSGDHQEDPPTRHQEETITLVPCQNDPEDDLVTITAQATQELHHSPGPVVVEVFGEPVPSPPTGIFITDITNHHSHASICMEGDAAVACSTSSLCGVRLPSHPDTSATTPQPHSPARNGGDLPHLAPAPSSKPESGEPSETKVSLRRTGSITIRTKGSHMRIRETVKCSSHRQKLLDGERGCCKTVTAQNVTQSLGEALNTHHDSKSVQGSSSLSLLHSEMPQKKFNKRIATKNCNDQVGNVVPNLDSCPSSAPCCSFCGGVLSAGDSFTCLPLETPLPQSLLNCTSLLQCLGVAFPPGVSGTNMNKATITLCQKCNHLLCEGDSAYKHMAEVVANMRQHWSGPAVPLPTSQDTFKVICENQPLALSQSGQFKHSAAEGVRRVRPILPKPEAPKERLPPSVSVRKRPQSAKMKLRPSPDLMICGLCGIDLYREEDWREHCAAVHRLEHHWRSPVVQLSLKTLLVKELQQNDSEWSGHSWRRCLACGQEFLWRKELVDHLQLFHKITVIEEFLSYGKGWEHSESSLEKAGAVGDGLQQEGGEKGDGDACVKDGEDVAKKTVGVCQQPQAQLTPDHHEESLGETAPSKGSLESGVQGRAGQWKCRVCAGVFSSQQDHDRHKAEEHPGSVRARRGKNVGKTAASTILSCQEVPLAQARGRVTCRLCGQVCDGQEDLDQHVDTCHEDSIVILEGDGQGGVTQRRAQLSQTVGTRASAVLRRQDGTRSFVCTACGEVFGNRLQLVKHKRAVHQELGGSTGLVMVECEVCGRRVHGLASLRLHVAKVHHRSHTPPHRHRCRLCLHHCHSRTQLETHMRDKHGVNLFPPVRCRDCGKTYSAKYIEKHIANMHENQKKFSCNFCAMKFNVESSLKAHISHEHANNRWVCQICPAEFEKYHQLRQHKTYVHSSQVHPCPHCPRTFKRKSDLTEHNKRRHQERVLRECSFCPKAYYDRKKLRTHLMKKHGVAWEDTLSKGYARLQRENNCLQRRPPKNPKVSRPNKGPYQDLEEGKGEQQPQGERCEQLGEGGSITTYEGAHIGTLEDQREYNVVHLTAAPDHLAATHNISYIILEEA